MKWKLFIEDEDYGRKTKLYLASLFQDGSIEVIHGAAFTKYAPIEPSEKAPWLELESGKARALMQTFMDEAWDMGLRPSDYRSHDKATQQHLRDLRWIIERIVGSNPLAEAILGTKTIIRPAEPPSQTGRAGEPHTHARPQEPLGAAQSGPGADWPKAPEDVQRDAGSDPAQRRGFYAERGGRSSN